MLTPYFEHMDPTRMIHLWEEGQTTPPNSQDTHFTKHMICQAYTTGFAPSAPSLPTSTHEEATSSLKVAPIYCMEAKRIYVDNTSVVLYQNCGGVVYKATVFDGYNYSIKTSTHVFKGKDLTPISIHDDWDNVHEVLPTDHLGHYTWETSF